MKTKSKFIALIALILILLINTFRMRGVIYQYEKYEDSKIEEFRKLTFTWGTLKMLNFFLIYSEDKIYKKKIDDLNQVLNARALLIKPESMDMFSYFNLKTNRVEDSWGNEILLQTVSGGVRILRSSGPDGKFENFDDIVWFVKES